ncbi:hypothetical protein [Poriferisphaera sp. WC338]|uniref:hypothetical protein n=1 Tax=Poriferisphaera sp. WC338 TaxID=3425129 RepID=UPI003D8155DC
MNTLREHNTKSIAILSTTLLYSVLICFCQDHPDTDHMAGTFFTGNLTTTPLLIPGIQMLKDTARLLFNRLCLKQQTALQQLIQQHATLPQTPAASFSTI